MFSVILCVERIRWLKELKNYYVIKKYYVLKTYVVEIILIKKRKGSKILIILSLDNF